MAQVGHVSVGLVGRVANATELTRGASQAAAADRDAALVASLLSNDGLEELDRIAGSLAALIYDHQRRQLFAWRSPGSERHLFVTANHVAAAAASDPRCLFASAIFERRLDLEAAADQAAQMPFLGRRSMFAGVQRVLPGEVILLGKGQGTSTIRRWQPRRRPQTFSSVTDAGNALRQTFDRAVADCISETGSVGLLLSSGRDSSAILASAVRQGMRIKSFTGAPAEGVAALPIVGRIADESDCAARVCASLAQQHVVCRPEPGDLLRSLDEIHRQALQPVGNLSNMPWYWAVLQAARAAGCDLLLNGAAGNFTISTGGRDYLWDVLAESGALRAGKVAWSTSGSDPGAWLNIANLVIGPRLPPKLRRAILKASGRYAPGPLTAPILAADVRADAERRAAANWHEDGAEGLAWRQAMLRDYDAANVLRHRFTGVESRDPTRDPRVIEFMLSLPPEMLVPRPENPRPVYAAAFGGDVSPEVILGKVRGYQGADWAGQFPVADVQKRLSDILDHPLNRQIFDRDFILGTVGTRPSDPRELIRDDVIDLHRNALIGGLDVANWIAVNFP